MDTSSTLESRWQPAGMMPHAQQSANRPSRRSLLARVLLWLLIFLPTLSAGLYYGLLATDRFVSEAQFVIRTGAKPVGSASFGALLQMTGLARSPDDVFAVQSFITSRDAVRALSEKLPLRQMYGHPEADFLARYPSLLYGASDEHLYKYLRWYLTPVYSSSTGITTLSVQAFRPDDAKAVAVELLDLAEQTVNRMNARIREDAVKVAQAEVKHSEERLISAQVALTEFRNKELMIDPARSTIVVAEIIARLSSELTQTQAQTKEMISASPSNPLLLGLRRRAAAIEGQILRERRRISDDSDGLARKLASYERLVLEREFAKQTLDAAAKTLEASRIDARRQELYLERIVEPGASDRATMPERLRTIATVFGFNLVGFVVGWLIISGIREHAAAREH